MNILLWIISFCSICFGLFILIMRVRHRKSIKMIKEDFESIISLGFARTPAGLGWLLLAIGLILGFAGISTGKD